MLKSYKISLVCTFMKSSWKELKPSFKKTCIICDNYFVKDFFLAVDKLI